jgi:hypothetical protein
MMTVATVEAACPFQSSSCKQLFPMVPKPSAVSRQPGAANGTPNGTLPEKSKRAVYAESTTLFLCVPFLSLPHGGPHGGPATLVKS